MCKRGFMLTGVGWSKMVHQLTQRCHKSYDATSDCVTHTAAGHVQFCDTTPSHTQSLYTHYCQQITRAQNVTRCQAKRAFVSGLSAAHASRNPAIYLSHAVVFVLPYRIDLGVPQQLPRTLSQRYHCVCTEMSTVITRWWGNRRRTCSAEQQCRFGSSQGDGKTKLD